MKAFVQLLTAAAVALLPELAFADDMSLGEVEYINSCAQCHGTAGKGDGVMAASLKSKVPDITMLTRNNAGVFPVLKMYEVIEGGGIPGPHGTREMPAWGDEFSAQLPRIGSRWGISEELREAVVRARILALIEYISSLQQN